ncbi:MAG: hypothetical protein SCH71_02435 [Desulfobulbaceae bacterium]|nr:hypothetical protein [Desulfobulbaceae bacterium]
MRRKFGLKGYLNQWSHRTMNFKEEKKLVGRDLFELENSGPIYREDSLDCLPQMSPMKRKEFFRKRHYLANKSLQEQLRPDDIFRAFSGLLDSHD